MSDDLRDEVARLARDVRRYLEAVGYEVEAGKHKHMKLRRPGHPMVLLPLQPQAGLSLAAARQIAHALGLATVNDLVAAVQRGPAASDRAEAH